MNKKGSQFFESIMWVWRSLFLLIVLFSVMLIVNKFVVTEMNVQDAESAVFMNWILYSGGLFTANGIVDGNVLDKGEIPGAEFRTNLIAAKLSISGKDVFYNKDAYDKWKPMADAKLTGGAGGVKRVTDKRVVLLDNKPTLMETDILTPNS